jgi:2-polyprenyl-6-methoxyphenol hydroxylase-like FAD-dependent oxidoreductase
MPGRRTSDVALVTTVPLPPPPTSITDWIKGASGVLSIVALLISSTFTFAVLIYSQRVDAAETKTYNEEHFETKSDAQRKYDELRKALTDIDKTTDETAKNVAAIMGALGIKPPQ